MKIQGYRIETQNPKTGEVHPSPRCSRIALEDNLSAFYGAIGCNYVSIITRRAEALAFRSVAIVLDDEGQLKPAPEPSGFTVSLRTGRIREVLVGNLLIFANDPSNGKSGLGSLSESDLEVLEKSTHSRGSAAKLPLFAI